mgnify:CR=1 FL=1
MTALRIEVTHLKEVEVVLDEERQFFGILNQPLPYETKEGNVCELDKAKGTVRSSLMSRYLIRVSSFVVSSENLNLNVRRGTESCWSDHCSVVSNPCTTFR